MTFDEMGCTLGAGRDGQGLEPHGSGVSGAKDCRPRRA